MHVFGKFARSLSLAVCATALALFAGSQAPAQTQAEAPAPKAETSKPAKKKAAKKPAKKLPVEAFGQLDFFDKPRLSPSGDYIAAMMATNGIQQINILPLAANSPQKRVQLGVPEETRVRWLQWVNDDYVLAGVTSLITFGRGGNEAYVSRLISISRETGDVKRLMWNLKGQNAADVIWTPSDGSNEILMTGQGSIYTNEEEFWPTVYRVNVATGRNTRVKKGVKNVLDWGADENGNLRFGVVSRDRSGSQQVLYRSEGQNAFSTIQRTDMREFEFVDLPFMFVPGTDNGLYIEDNEDGKGVIKEINLRTRDVVSIRHELEDTDILSIYRSFDGKSILGVRTNDKDKPIRWLDKDMVAAQTFLDENVKGADARIVAFNRNRTRMLVKLVSSRNPGLYYIYDAPYQQLSKLAAVNEAIGNKTLAKPKYVTYKARDGLEIEGVLTLPQGREAKNLPLVMMPHGGPWSYSSLGYNYWAQFLANRGYAVMQPNFRGSTGYGREFMTKGFGQMGLAMQDDVTDGMNYLAEQGIIDPKRVCIIGASYGGYSAMWGVVKDPDLYRCSISIAGVSNVRRDVNAFGGTVLSRTFSAQWKKMSSDFKSISPVNFVDQITVPMLLIHGKRDDSVDYKQSTRMEKKMRDAGKDVEMLILPEADHYFLRQDDRIALLTAMEGFLKKHNPPD